MRSINWSLVLIVASVCGFWVAFAAFVWREFAR